MANKSITENFFDSFGEAREYLELMSRDYSSQFDIVWLVVVEKQGDGIVLGTDDDGFACIVVVAFDSDKNQVFDESAAFLPDSLSEEEKRMISKDFLKIMPSETREH